MILARLRTPDGLGGAGLAAEELVDEVVEPGVVDVELVETSVVGRSQASAGVPVRDARVGNDGFC